MTGTDIQHESLLLPGFWRITSFGKLFDNPLLGKPDLRIRTNLALLSNTVDFPPECGKIIGPLRSMLLPVGELPRLHINAVLHDGRLVSHKINRLLIEEILTRNLDCSKQNIRVIERFQLDEQGYHVIPVRKKWEGQLSDPEMHGLFVAIGSENDPYETVIPATEVFRFFYATSDVLAKALLRGDFLDPGTNLWNPHKTGIADEGKAIIWLRKRMLDADARFLARFAFSQYALKQAQEIFLYAAAIGPSINGRIIRALPPFEDTVSMRFLGRRMGGPYNNRVLVSRLLQCSWRPGFTELKWDRDNDGRYDPDRREERPVTNWGAGLTDIPDHHEQTPTKLADTPPSIHNVPSRLREEEIFERFPELGAVPAEKMPQEDAETRAELTDWRAIAEEAFKGSVINGKSSWDKVGITIIEGMEKAPEQEKEQTDAVDLSVGQADYLIVLRLLKLFDEDMYAGAEFITVLDSTATAHGVQFNVYPCEMDGKQKAWLYIDKNKETRRMALIAEIHYYNSIRYLVELQQRRPVEASTLVIWNSEETKIPPKFLAHMLMDCARAECARLDSAPNFELEWARLHHTLKTVNGESAERFLVRIFDARPIYG